MENQFDRKHRSMGPDGDLTRGFIIRHIVNDRVHDEQTRMKFLFQRIRGEENYSPSIRMKILLLTHARSIDQ